MKLRHLVLILGAIGVCAAVPALADLTYTQGSGTTIFDFLCFTSKHCSAHVNINSSGTEVGTSGSPISVNTVGTLPAFAATPTFNCGTGCSSPAGTFNNNSDAVATSTTNLQSATWLYGWNGTTWDRVHTDATNGVWVNVKSTVLQPGAATSAKQPALGVAGTASTDILTVQGIASMTPLLITPSNAANWGLGATAAAVPSSAQFVGMSQAGNLTGMTGTSGNLNVQCANCSGSGVSTVDEAPYTAATSIFAGSGGFFQTTATSNALTSGQQGMWQMTANRAGFVNLRNAAGAEIGTSGAPVSVNVTADANEGTTIDAPCTLPATAAACTMEALAKAIANGINSSIPTGNNLVGKMGIDQTTPGTTNGVQGKIWDGTNIAAVKAATTAPVAADPAIVTTKSPNSPDIPFAAYSTASITRSANTTTYTANTGWNNGTPAFFSFTAACRANGAQILIPRIDIWSSANPALKLTGVLWLFSAVPGTNIGDNAAFAIASADFANLTGSFSGLSFSLANNQASGASNSSVTLIGTTYQGQCASGTTTITGMVQVTNAYVPASAEVLHIGVATVGAN